LMEKNCPGGVRELHALNQEAGNRKEFFLQAEPKPTV